MSSSRRSLRSRRFVVTLALLFALPANAVSSQDRASAAGGIQAEPVDFLHEDEKREGDGFLVIADRRIFAVTAFANAMGYDTEMGPEMHPVRVRVRETLAERLAEHPDRQREWKAFYDGLDLPIFVFLDYALSLNSDFPFRRVRPDDELGYPQAADKLAELPEVLNDFWRVTDLGGIWESVKPVYAEELARYDFDRMSHELAFLWNYLRMERHDPFILVNVPDLVNTHYHGIGAQYGRYYYQVESPGSHSYGLNVHEYLHSIVNPLVQAAAPAFEEKIQAYFEVGKEGELAASYQHPVGMAQECMVRALDHRLRVLLDDSGDAEETAARVQARVEELTAGGLVFTGPFFELLGGFEESELAFGDYLPELLRRLPQPPPER